MKPTKRLRWWIVWTLFFSTVINYVDRQTLSNLAPVITKEFHMTNTEYGLVVSSFQIAYAVMWLVGGVLLDLIGTRLGLTIAMIWWSLASMLPSLAHSVRFLALSRFLLGIGEGFNWPGASKTVAEWFPAKERGLAVGIFDSGSSVGGALAAVMIPWLAIIFGWRAAFLMAGCLGFVWLALWLSLYRPMESHPRLTAEERQLIESGRETAAASTRHGVARYLHLLTQRNVWGIVLGRSLTDPIWWFYIFWLPKYLSDTHGFSLKQIAAFTWLPFVASDLGNFTGGLASGFLIRRGVHTVRARKAVCVASCVPILAGIPAALAGSPYWALALICVATWGYAAWSTMGLTFPSDLFPRDVVASVTGLSGLGAAGLSAVSTLAVGWMVDRFSYLPAFVAAGTMPLLATLIVLVLIRAPQKSL
ncbi:MAG: MFS transporter [Terriglobia bacterium]|jgi:ACS family hexuronate transporter-like MFS transporter